MAWYLWRLQQKNCCQHLAWFPHQEYRLHRRCWYLIASTVHLIHLLHWWFQSYLQSSLYDTDAINVIAQLPTSVSLSLDHMWLHPLSESSWHHTYSKMALLQPTFFISLVSQPSPHLQASLWPVRARLSCNSHLFDSRVHRAFWQSHAFSHHESSRTALICFLSVSLLSNFMSCLLPWCLYIDRLGEWGGLSSTHGIASLVLSCLGAELRGEFVLQPFMIDNKKYLFYVIIKV